MGCEAPEVVEAAKGVFDAVALLMGFSVETEGCLRFDLSARKVAAGPLPPNAAPPIFAQRFLTDRGFAHRRPQPAAGLVTHPLMAMQAAWDFQSLCTVFHEQHILYAEP
jgi:hypothetical protein